jgi:hypothetical protein
VGEDDEKRRAAGVSPSVHEEIGGHDLARVIGEKGAPRL